MRRTGICRFLWMTSKRRTWLLLLLAGAGIMLGACGGEHREKPAPEEIYLAVRETVALPPMVEMDGAFLMDYYGIDPTLLDGYVFALAEDPASGETIMILRAGDQKDVETLADAAESVIKQKAAEMRNYGLPAQYQAAAESKVRTDGDYVYLVISPEAEKIERAIRMAMERP